MSVESFLDTNVLVYQIDTTDARKHRIADRLVTQALHEASACISFQVLQECLNTALRTSRVGLSVEQAQAWLETVLEPLCTVLPGLGLYRRGLALQARWQFSFYDALIVAAALEGGCKRLLSEDLQHGQRIEGLRVENPFRV